MASKGAKRGRGRPSLSGETGQRYQVTIPPTIADRIRAFGKGSLSRGIVMAMQQWEPIETAPTDGTLILVYAPRKWDLPAMQSLCKWHPDAGFCVDEIREPTHWMPLPEPPVNSGGDRG